MSLLDAEVVPEIEGLGISDRRAWFAVRLRPQVAASESGVRLVLTLDRSSSMAGHDFTQARAAARVLVHLLSAEDELALVVFDEQVHVALTPRAMDEAGKAAATAVLAGLTTGRGTALFDAAKVSLALAGELRHGHVILITDGFPFSGITDLGQLLEMTRTTAGAATLTTIGVGSDLDGALLCAMAGVAGGRFLHLEEHGDFVMTLGGELATVQDAVTGKLECEVRSAQGFSIATMPHYAPSRAGESGSLRNAMLAPVVESVEVVVPFELEWDSALGPGEHRAALVTVNVGAPGAAATQVLELPVRVVVGRARGAMNGTVTRAVCEIMAGRALHQAALGEDQPLMCVRLLADAAGWVRGRASAAGLDLRGDLAPTLRLLDATQGLFQAGRADAPLLHACAEGVAKRYDASIGSKVSLMEDLRTDGQRKGSLMASRVDSDPGRRRE